uniref:SLAM family member 7-like n=1 Tax=Sinocyclocheilus anshuiensis TaxID=1608454 RepID=A0A671LAT2_9TELE
MTVNHILVLLLFPLTFKTGFSAEISVFVQTGDSVQLDIQTQERPEFDFLSWSNDKSEIIVRYTSETNRVKLHSSYKDRVDFNNKTFSLTLKNMQKTDSGLYTAKTTGDSENIVTYRVSVIDAVEAPVLTMNSNGSSSDSCTVNFTCRAHELMIDSSYQNNSCSPEEVTSQINTLILNCNQKSIICNHSNPVSWKEDRIIITQLCDDNKKNNSKNVQTDSSLLVPVVASVAVIILIIICLSVFLYCRCKKGSRNAESQQ